MEKKQYFCSVTNEPLPDARVEALLSMGVPEDQMTSIAVAKKSTRKKQALYTGLAGVSDMIICDKVYNDSVRGAFYEADSVSDTTAEED